MQMDIWFYLCKWILFFCVDFLFLLSNTKQGVFGLTFPNAFLFVTFD